MLPDYSEWLVGDKIGKEETAWASSQLYRTHASHIALLRSKFSIFKILELGCGTGWVPTQFGADVSYIGVDKNPNVLAIARAKNLASRTFIEADLRDVEFVRSVGPSPDLVCAFAVLKHFSLCEFERIFSGILSLGNLGVFSMNIAEENRDDGIEFHHIWTTKEWLLEILEKNGFGFLHKTLMWQGETWEKKTGEEWIFSVRRRT